MIKKKPIILSLLVICAFTLLLVIDLFIIKRDMIKDEELLTNLIQNGYTMFHYVKPSMFLAYEQLFSHVIVSILMFLPPFIVMFPGLYSIFSIVKSGDIKYIANFRKKYNKTIKGEIINCYKYSFIVPIMYIIIILGCGIITGFNMNLSESLLDANYYSISFGNPYILIFCTFINLLLADIFYLNIGLLTMLKTKNIFINIIFSYLIIVIFGIGAELTGIVIARATGHSVWANIFNFYNLWHPMDSGNILYVMLFLVVISILSTLIVLFKYKNEERVVNNV